MSFESNEARLRLQSVLVSVRGSSVLTRLARRYRVGYSDSADHPLPFDYFSSQVVLLLADPRRRILDNHLLYPVCLLYDRFANRI